MKEVISTIDIVFLVAFFCSFTAFIYYYAQYKNQKTKAEFYQAEFRKLGAKQNRKDWKFAATNNALNNSRTKQKERRRQK